MNKTLVLLTLFTLTIATPHPLLAKGGGKKGGSDKTQRDAASVFAAIDKDGSGSITRQELGDSKRFKNAGKGEMAKAFADKDLNDNGEISLHEFEKSFGSRSKETRGKKHGDGGSSPTGKRGGKKS